MINVYIVKDKGRKVTELSYYPNTIDLNGEEAKMVHVARPGERVFWLTHTTANQMIIDYIRQGHKVTHRVIN